MRRVFRLYFEHVTVLIQRGTCTADAPRNADEVLKKMKAAATGRLRLNRGPRKHVGEKSLAVAFGDPHNMEGSGNSSGGHARYEWPYCVAASHIMAIHAYRRKPTKANYGWKGHFPWLRGPQGTETKNISFTKRADQL
jgi:hypothetical protein